jgi:DNA-3-methyladenine glycosylase I
MADSESSIKRCSWVTDDPIYIKYHDEEWGIPVYDDKKLYEFLILEGAQAGLSWITVLNRRQGYEKVFHNFNVNRVSQMDEKEVTQVLANPEIIRNKLKVKSAVKNAKVFIDIQNEFGSFSKYLWAFVGNEPIVGEYKSLDEVPISTQISDLISKDLKKRGMSFVGSTIVYAYMQAVGLVNDHTADCSFKARFKV